MSYPYSPNNTDVVLPSHDQIAAWQTANNTWLVNNPATGGHTTGGHTPIMAPCVLFRRVITGGSATCFIPRAGVEGR